MHTLRDFLKASINNEKKIKQLYEQGRKITKSGVSQKCLGFLIRDEDEHIEVLEEILNNKLYDLDCEIPNDEAFEKARRAYGEIELKCCDDSTVEEILRIALEREYHAQMQYEALAQICKIPEMAVLLKNLAKEDEEHRKLIDKEYKAQRGMLGEEF